MVATAGMPFLVSAALASARPLSATSIAQSAFFALIERLRRLDEPDLDTLLIASLSSDLGAADLAAALEVSAERAQTLIDRARATGLVEPSHSPHFLRSVHRAVAQIVGNARHHDVESALLRSQVAMSTLSTALALRLAEHGMRDAGLAEALRKQADAVRAEPAAAARLYRAAVDAGAADLRPQLADALALCGEMSGRRERGRRPARLRRIPPSGPLRCASRRASRRTTATTRRRPNCSPGSGRTPTR